MTDREIESDSLQIDREKNSSSTESSFFYDLESSRSILALRAERLGKSIIDDAEQGETAFLLFDCAKQKFAISPALSHGFIASARLYAIPTLSFKGVSLVIFNGQQVPIFDISLNRKVDGITSADLLILGREKAEFGLVVESQVSLESLPSESFIEYIPGQKNPLVSNVIAINSEGRMLIGSENIMKSGHFNLAIGSTF